IVEQAVQAAQAAARPGTLCSKVDAAARQVITDAGFGPAFTHRTGHGLGIDVHEPPYIAANINAPLKQGNVFSIEPGIYIKNTFGIRLEEIGFRPSQTMEIRSDLPRTVRHLGVRNGPRTAHPPPLAPPHFSAGKLPQPPHRGSNDKGHPTWHQVPGT
ncbi:MAG: M24 family metallopeptidase, partial [Rhodobacteraceae bacterium]|nr:M24 family metallopeptidase [Paracoccaceae bacterium]